MLSSTQIEKEKKADQAFLDKFQPVINRDLCQVCKTCVKECSYQALESKANRIVYKGGCVACGRCIAVCPNRAIEVRTVPSPLPPHATFTDRIRYGIVAQASSGGVLTSSCGNDMQFGTIFDELLLDAAQVTNPAIDPLREPVETRMYLGRRSGKLDVSADGCIMEGDTPVVAMDMPVMLGHISLGAISYNAQKSLFMAAKELNILAGSGEGGLHQDFYVYADHINSEVASGRFGVTPEYLKRTAAVEIKNRSGGQTRSWWSSTR